jgi:hypothetical protein
METQKNIKEPKSTASGGSKSAGGRKQPGAATATATSPEPAEGAAQGGT